MATNPYPPYNPRAHALELMGWTGDAIAKLFGIEPPATGVTMAGEYIPNPQGLGWDLIPPDNPAGLRELWTKRGLDPETGRPKPWTTRAAAEALPQYTNTGWAKMAGLEQSRPGPVDITRQLPKSPTHGLGSLGDNPPSKVVKMRLAWDEMFTKQEQGKIAKGSKDYFGPIQREFDEVLEASTDWSDESGSIRKHPYKSRGPFIGRGENIHKMPAHPFNPSSSKDLMKIVTDKKLVAQLMKFGKSFGNQALQMMILHPRIPG